MRYFNPTADAVVYDTAGHQVAGHEHVDLNVKDPVTAALLNQFLECPLPAKAAKSKTTGEDA